MTSACSRLLCISFVYKCSISKTLGFFIEVLNTFATHNVLRFKKSSEICPRTILLDVTTKTLFFLIRYGTSISTAVFPDPVGIITIAASFLLIVKKDAIACIAPN